MTKRTVALILILLTLLPALCVAGGVLFAPKSPFEQADTQRESAIESALGNGNTKGEAVSPLPESQRYIVQFKKNTELEKIESVLNGIPYRLLAESEQRIFAISLESKDFFKSHGDIIDYYEPDFARESLALTNDPVALPVYESAGINTAWDSVKASSDIIVAVLDTGVNRTHEDIAGINLLPGYDAVTKTAYVDGDAVGHGTGVIGIIAAQADNGLGIAGVAHGVTVLPVKVSTGGTTIYSSDLIAGIRFAADAGAKIINMSIGGYSFSYAEEDAVNYAAEKGCILISAAGNGGNRPYADQKSYPASYDNVISVASCNENGERSDFSQYNDAVDVAVNGELLTLPYVDELGASVYRTDSGTSYSCAIVSGIAALAATKAGTARFGGDEFLALIIDTCGNKRTDELGYGIINASTVVTRASLPIITGISNLGRYSDSVRIGFNRGTATLDGEPFEDGETVIESGRHIITVVDGKSERSMVFILDYDPLSYEFKKFATFACFEFARGTALLDGFPYLSGDRISTTGRHEFVLTDGDERLEKTIDLQYSLPAVYGVENGGVYNSPIEIKIIGNGYAELDGVEIFGEAAVCESGSHTLTVKSIDGAISEEYAFELDFPHASSYLTDYENASAAVDSENRYFCLYGESLVGARIYDISLPEQYAYFLPIERVYSHAFTEEYLILFSEGGITLLDRKNALSGEEAAQSLGFIGESSYYIYAENEIYGFGNNMMRKISLDGSFEDIRRFSFTPELVYYSNGLFCLLAPSSDRLARIYDPINDTLSIFDIGRSIDGVPLCYGDGYLAVGNELIDTASRKCVLEFCSNYAVKIENGLLYTDNRIIEISTGKELGSFAYQLSDIEISENRVYLFGTEAVMTVIDEGVEGIAKYGAAVRCEYTLSPPEQINPYRTDVFYSPYSKVLSAKASGETVFLLFSDKNSLCGFSSADFGEQASVPLRFSPKKLFVSGGYVAVCFEERSEIYLAPESSLSDGVYINLPAICDSAAVANGRLYAVSGGRITHCLPDGSNVAITSIRASSVDSDGERLYVLDDDSLSVYNENLLLLGSVQTNAKDFVLGKGVAVGGVVYDPTLNAEFAHLDGEILTVSNSAIITEDGVFDLVNSQYIGTLGLESPKAAAVTSSNSVVSFGNALVSVCSFGNGIPVTQSPEIRGITESSIYIDSVVIEYSHGIGYLDGKPFESGSAASGAGTHTFLVSLPCGRSVSVNFTIEANIEAIEFLVGDRIMSVGETVTLRVKYLPEGAGSVPAVFQCDSDGITISESGVITANKIGVYTVTALAETDYSSFRASCIITVRDDLLVFNGESGLRIDRNSGLAIGIPPATDSSSLLSQLINPNGVSVTDKDGRQKSGVIGTGDKIVLTKNGEVTDTLTAVVPGDCDGDGYISAYDIYIHERILRGQSYESAFIAAADVNGNGITADNDHRALKNLILRPGESNAATPPENLFGLSSVQTLTYIESGSVIDVAICISGCKYTRGVSGVLEISEGLEFIEAEAAGWEIGAKDIGNGKISFFAHGNNGENCEKAFKVLLVLRFRVTAEAGSTVEFASNGFTASFKDGCKTVRFEPSSSFVYGVPEGEFNIAFHNAQSFVFDPEKYDYTAVIPYNSALADISVTRKADFDVAVSGLVIDDTGKGTVSISVTDKNGSTTLYTIRVRRDDEPRFDTNCRLATLEIEGHRLSPLFNPDILDYSVSVPYGTEKINLYCVAQSPSARVIIGDTTLKGSVTPITITVGSPDGESLTYTVYVNILPPIVESSEQSLPDDTNDGISLVTVLAIIGALVFAAAVITMYIKLAKRDEELRNKE
ncbi:MAG: S8 family serine peptidase [Clostridia bacterium]|nr:S8 family serine peptidase [Clostridia bacterium]